MDNSEKRTSFDVFIVSLFFSLSLEFSLYPERILRAKGNNIFVALLMLHMGSAHYKNLLISGTLVTQWGGWGNSCSLGIFQGAVGGSLAEWLGRNLVDLALSPSNFILP
jgi:hypothetical protein